MIHGMILTPKKAYFKFEKKIMMFFWWVERFLLYDKNFAPFDLNGEIQPYEIIQNFSPPQKPYLNLKYFALTNRYLAESSICYPIVASLEWVFGKLQSLWTG